MSELMLILVQRGDYTPAEAKAAVREAKQRVMDGEDPEEVLYEEFGLEPDYALDLL